MTYLPSTRAEALERLAAFLPGAGKYARRRNHVEPGHENVSRLSPATRTRLLLQTEICATARERYSPRTIEKFEQEVWWRSYWKGWLEMRPGVWSDYRRDLAALEWSERARLVAAGESGVAIMDSFAEELISTGYMHNHARMWWAAFWIHVERLPWQLGADFFLRHLFDGDAASNTLSWRWVAGLHTRGKSYLVRRSNVERYVDKELLDGAREGLERLEVASTLELPYDEPPAPEPLAEEADPILDRAWGLWIHDEDLLLERSPLGRHEPAAIAAFLPVGTWKEHRYAPAKRAFLRAAIDDGAERAGRHFGVSPDSIEAGALAEEIAGWARRAGLEAVAAMRPFVGTLADELDAIERALAQAGVRLVLVRRSDEVPMLKRATAGFFGFWKKTRRERERAIADAAAPV